LAGVGLTVPAEPRDAGLARAEVDLPDELPVRAADLHLHGVGADGEPHGGLDPALAEVPLLGADQHVAADQPGRLERLVGDERLGQRRERPLEARDAGHRAELRELPEELAALEGPERILVLELRDHELEEPLLTEAAVVVLGPKLGARAAAVRCDPGNHGAYLCPSDSVRNRSCFAVLITSRLLWYERDADNMFAISSTALTFAA